MTTALSSFVVLVTLALTHGYINEYDKPFNFNCENGKIISYLSSIHDNYYEDRIWEIHCRSAKYTNNCIKTDYVNEMDKPVSFSCPGRKVLVGIESYHEDYYEDRRFKFNCCTASDSPSACYTTDYVNDWDKKLTLFVPEGQAIKSVYSYHENYYEDRRWRFEICKL